MMHISTRGVAFVASFEGFSSHPYWDRYGRVWTIGFGETEGVGPNTPPITRAEGLVRLRRKLDGAYADAVRSLGLPLNQNQFDALVSLVYNVGPGILSPSHSIGAALRAHRWSTAANDFLLYSFAGGVQLLGLVRRRRAERALFLKAATPAAALRLARLRASVRRIGHWTPGRKLLAKQLERELRSAH